MRTNRYETIIRNQLYLTDHRNSRHYYVFLCFFKRQSTEFNVFGIRNINYLQHGAGIGFGIGFVSLKSCRINCIKYLFGVCGSWYWGLVLRKNTKGDPGIVGGRVMWRSPVSSHFQLWSFVAVSGFPLRVLQVLDVFLGSNSVTKRSCGGWNAPDTSFGQVKQNGSNWLISHVVILVVVTCFPGNLLGRTPQVNQ